MNRSLLGIGAFIASCVFPTRPPLGAAQPATQCQRCSIELRLVFQLGAPTDSIILVQTSNIAADSRGRYYATAAGGRQIALFDARGRFVRVFARGGEGPAEISVPHPNLYIGPGDTLYVAEGPTVKVFSPEQRWVRTYTSPAVGALHFLANGDQLIQGFLFAGTSVRPYPLHLVGADQFIRKSFGVTDPLDPRCSWCFLFAAAVSHDRSSIWASAPGTYELLNFTSEGILSSRFRIMDSPWYEDWDPRSTMQRGTRRDFPRIERIHHSATGSIIVQGVSPLPSGSRATRPNTGAVIADAGDPFASWSSVLDVLDERTHGVRASLRLEQREFRLLNNGTIALRRNDADGYLAWEIRQITLTERR